MIPFPVRAEEQLRRSEIIADNYIWAFFDLHGFRFVRFQIGSQKVCFIGIISDF